MISVQSVTKRFGEKKALDSVTFRAKPGDIIGFLGPNGAGKTTTLRLLVGYLRADQGSIIIRKCTPAANRIELLRHVGYLPETNPLYGDLTVKEYLQFIADSKHVSEYTKIVDEVGLRDVLNTRIEQLSRGYKQRVGLAAALIGNPQILLLDEPTSGLDPLEQEKIRKYIKKISKKKIIIFSTHILSEAERIATRLMIINHGTIVYDGRKPRQRKGIETLFRKLMKKKR